MILTAVRWLWTACALLGSAQAVCEAWRTSFGTHYVQMNFTE